MAEGTPQSRVEEILFNTINGEPYNGIPQSRIEELLLELKAVIEEGGGGGHAYSETTIFSGGTNETIVYPLSSSISNFDAIEIRFHHNDDIDDYGCANTYTTSYLLSLIETSTEVLGFTNDIWYNYFSVESTTELRLVKKNAGWITDIIGIKY